jgi:CheY-like chemotaxis protein
MPGLTGTEVTQLIRQFDQTTPIIFYTAAAYEGHKKAALDSGAQAYLIKPVGVDALLDEVEKLITKPRFLS